MRSYKTMESNSLMTNIDPNLRKAAVLLRSMDADTTAMMLAQLSPAEASTLRNAIRSLGPVDPDEQADVMSELRREGPAKQRSTSGDVELALSSAFDGETYSEPAAFRSSAGRSNRFEFLESAPTTALVPYLAREHAQTIAVVLSHLAPERAASILAALPQKLQADAIDRLTTLGETDPDSVNVLERELESWVANRESSRASKGRRADTMAAILAAADHKSRSQILACLKNHKNGSDGIPPKQYDRRTTTPKAMHVERRTIAAEQIERPSAPSVSPLPHMAFDDLIHLDSRALASVLRQADANVLALALAGSHDEMIDRICEQMPKRMSRTFRRELRRLGPTRLSDVEAAQRAVAQIAARQLAGRQPALSRTS